MKNVWWRIDLMKVGYMVCMNNPQVEDRHWKKSQISKYDQSWILIGFYNIQIDQIAKFGFKLDFTWIL